MIYTLNPSKIASFLRKKLKESDELEQFCQEKYGKSFSVSGVFDELNPPTEKDSPVLILLPLGKEEGGDLDSYSYDFVSQLQILPTSIEKGEDELCEMLQLIQKVIFYSHESQPLSSWRVALNLSGGLPLMAGYADFQYNIPPTLGVEMNF